MTVAEGGGRRAVTRKFQDVYMPALKANFMIWPAVQLLNFRVMPLQFQIVCTPENVTDLACANGFAAFCVYGWNSMDSIPVTNQLLR